MTDTAGEFIQRQTPEKRFPKVGGVIEDVKISKDVSSGTHKAREIVQDAVLEAVPLSEKRDLGNDTVQMVDIPEAVLAYGGQDCAGVLIIDNGRIQCVFAAADGCSFGDKKGSAEAARVAVKSALSSGYKAAKQTHSTRQQVTDELKRGLITAHEQIKSRGEGGVTTAVSGAISLETNEQGKEQIYLHYASVGDAQLILLATKTDGTVHLQKLTQPADVVEQYLRREGFNYDTVKSLQEIQKAREVVIEKHKGTDTRVAQAANVGITSFLGDNSENNEGAGEVYRINLSTDVFAQGMRNLKLIACSDNVGEKLDENFIKAAYGFGKAANGEIAAKLNTAMIQANADDGCMAIISVGRVK